MVFPRPFHTYPTLPAIAMGSPSAADVLHRFFESAVRYFKEFDRPSYNSDLKIMILEVCSFGIHKKNSGFVSKNEFIRTMCESNLQEIIQSEKLWQIKMYLRLSLISPFHLKGLKRITRLLLN